MIVVNLSALDVVRLAHLRTGETALPASTRDEVELFCQAVMPCLFSYVNEAPLHIVMGLLGILLDRVDMRLVATTKVGLSLLTMFLSRAELVKQAGAAGDEKELEQW
jgi:DNA topoisomerase 2-associated protein PAT1